MNRHAIELYCEQTAESLALSQRTIDSLLGHKKVFEGHVNKLSKLWPDFSKKYLALHREVLSLKERTEKHLHYVNEDMRPHIKASFTKIELAESVIKPLLFHSDISDLATLRHTMGTVLDNLHCIHRHIKILEIALQATLPKDD